MKFTWNQQKNELLKATRNISFEDIVDSIQNGNVLDIVENTKNNSYQGQEIFILLVEKDNYIYEVPFRKNNSEINLITAFRNRKLNKRYNK